MARQMPYRQADQSGRGRLERWWRRITSTQDDDPGVTPEVASQPIIQCEDRDKVVVSGTITSITQMAKGDQPKLVVEVRDESGSLTVAWIGRRSIPGVEDGRLIRLHGRVSCQNGSRTMYNPRYELLAD